MLNLVSDSISRSTRLPRLATLVCLILLAGCAGRPLMPTPDLYTEHHKEPFLNLAPELKSNQVDLLYATDRVLEQDEEGRPFYGYQRSLALAFGNALVSIGNGIAWEQLETDSRQRDRSSSLQLKLEGFSEMGRFPESPYLLTLDAERNLVTDPEIVRLQYEAAAMLQAEIKRRLALTKRKEIFLYVHGFNTRFPDAAFIMAELWHFLGREGIPMIYTWPAGRGGLGGYIYDRESGEFTVFHFKELLRALARMPEIEAIHILAYSRGTDLTLTGLRELFIEADAAGVDPLQHYRIKNLVLAAPDIDVYVLSQRILAERLEKGAGRITIYTSTGDRAISLAEDLFKSERRLGRMVWSDVPKEHREVTARILLDIKRVDFVEYRGKGGRFGHGYFYENPAASSDLILIMRYQAEPGTDERPLKEVSPHFWQLEEGYLDAGRAASGGTY